MDVRVLSVVLLGACTTALDDPTPYVTDARVLAVQVEPAEAEESDVVAFNVLYADASGPLTDPAGDGLDWGWCTALKPLAELGPVATQCLDPASEDLSEIGSGLTLSATLPDDSCSRFGPNPPPSVDGQPAGRATDPDVTGGYYQPGVGFDDGDPTTLVAARIRCGLASVTQETSIDWNQHYHSNTNPSAPQVDIDGVDATETLVVAAGQSVAVTAAWPECPATASCGDAVCSPEETATDCAEDCTTPVGCGGAERYVAWDAAARVLLTRTEAISATWFTTGGELAEARNGVSGDASATSVTNTWTAPDAPGDAWLGVVLRDERGGVSYSGVSVSVE